MKLLSSLIRKTKKLVCFSSFLILFLFWVFISFHLFSQKDFGSLLTKLVKEHLYSSWALLVSAPRAFENRGYNERRRLARANQPKICFQPNCITMQTSLGCTKTKSVI